MTARKLLRRKAASGYLQERHGLARAPSTLAKLAVTGGGPVFRRIGRVPLYSTNDLDDWVASGLSAPMRSTSEAAEATVAAVPVSAKTVGASKRRASVLEREGPSHG
jgi:hypothetical protein